MLAYPGLLAILTACGKPKIMGHILLMAHHLGPASAIFCPVGTRLGAHRAASEAHLSERHSLQHALQQRIQFGFRVDGLDLG